MSKEKKQPQWEYKRWISCDIEEEYLGQDRKGSKQERKIASAKDRSKYKKTDQDQLKKNLTVKIPDEELLKGRVLSVHSQGLIVEYDHHEYLCHLRGVLKKDKGLLKNLVTVGDFVLFSKTSETEGSIAFVEPRRTMLSRADNLSRRKEQLIAANIDQVIITVSVVSPLLKPSLVDRYIISAKKGGMDPIVLVNKIDLLEDEEVYDPIVVEAENILYQEFLEAYHRANIPIIPFSVVTGEGIEALKAVMKDKASVFSGQSGVGKSSIINLVTGRELKTGKIVDRTQKGSHTTTMAQLLPLEFGGWCIDTPGIKSFGVWDLQKEEIKYYFPEFNAFASGCKFPNCDHLHEENCAVMDAVEREEISPLRYESYQNLMETMDDEHLRR